jgi:hypothetical protein
MEKLGLRCGIIGAPGSGKSTVMAELFAELKKLGYHTEFLPEEARSFIRFKKRLYNSNAVYLSDDDQASIGTWQAGKEDDHGKDYILVTDGSVANISLYLSKPNLEDFKKQVARYDVLFFARNFESASQAADSGRIHDYKFSLEVEQRAFKLLSQINFDIGKYSLYGSMENRLEKALALILEKINENRY